jgi:hypothetical protein
MFLSAEGSVQSTILEAENSPHHPTEFGNTFILEFPAFGTMINKFLFLINYAVQVFSYS